MSRETEAIFVSLYKQGVISIDGEGRVWRLKRCFFHRGSRSLVWYDIKPRKMGCLLSNGYRAVSVGINGVTYGAKEHRVVWSCLAGTILEGMQINHKDGDKLNNAMANLELVTNRENMDHAKQTGLVTSGERNPRARLTRIDVDDIRRALSKGIGQSELARSYGVRSQTINNIATGHSWKGL